LKSAVLVEPAGQALQAPFKILPVELQLPAVQAAGRTHLSEVAEP